MRTPALLKHLVTTEYRLVDLAAACGLHAPDLSRIVNSKRPCGRITLFKLLSGLKPEHQSQVLQAWLQDQIPPEWAQLVHIVRQAPTSSVAEAKPGIGTVEGALDVLESAAASNKHMHRLLVEMAKMYSGQ